MKNKGIGSFFIGGLLLLTSCGGGNGNGPDPYNPLKQSPDAKSFIAKMNKKFSEIPAQFGGLKISFVRHGMKEAKYLIIKNEITSGTGAPNDFGSTSFTAIDLSNYNENVPLEELDYKAYDDVIFNANTGMYDHEASGLSFEETSGNSKDLEKAGAFIEDYKNEMVAEAIGYEFGFSEERSYKVAKLVSSWNKISSKRDMTRADMDMFTHELLGVDSREVESSIKGAITGDNSGIEELTNVAADVNDISPEHMSEIISEILM